MSDSEEKKRPNAKYRLTGENADERDIVYRYNRERRLEYAPQSVRDLYEEDPPRRFGLFKTLINSRPKRMSFASIIILCLAISIVSIFGLTDNSVNLSGNRVSVQAFRLENSVNIVLQKSVRNNLMSRFNQPYTGAVHIAVVASDIEENIYFYRVLFTPERSEEFRFTVPFDSDTLTVVMQTETRTVTATVTPE